jgi:hypothetical protein
MRPIIFMLLCTVHLTSWAQIDDFHTDIIEMMTLRGDEINFSLAYHDVFPKLKRNFAKRNVDPSAWENLQKDEAQAVAELLEQSAYAYRQFLNRSEINELIEFYSGSAGQNYAMDGDLSAQEQKEIKLFFKSPTGLKYRQKSDSIAMTLDQIKSDWSSALFKQKMRELIKGGYLNN